LYDEIDETSVESIFVEFLYKSTFIGYDKFIFFQFNQKFLKSNISFSFALEASFIFDFKEFISLLFQSIIKIFCLSDAFTELDQDIRFSLSRL